MKVLLVQQMLTVVALTLGIEKADLPSPISL